MDDLGEEEDVFGIVRSEVMEEGEGVSERVVLLKLEVERGMVMEVGFEDGGMDLPEVVEVGAVSGY